MADDRSRPTADPPRSWWRAPWLIPALTFLVGLLLGGVVIGLLRSGTATTASPEPAATSTPSGPAAPTSSPAGPITIPAECVQIATDSQQLLTLLDEAVGAARDLDAGKLSGIVAQLQDQQERVSTQAAACRAAAGASPSAG
jgi:hypothetical protein